LSYAKGRSGASAQLAVSVLAPADQVDAAMTASVRRALESEGVMMQDGPGDALVLVGGLESRCFLDAATGAVRADVVDAVREAHAQRRWIAAVGLSAVAALKALELQLGAGHANRLGSDGGVAIFADLRLMCLERPMLCEIECERDAAITHLIRRLACATAP
jgi:hypothetical protein